MMSDDEKNYNSKGDNICRDFKRGICKRKFCKFEHPTELGSAQFCHDYQNGHCSRANCRYIHCTKEEEEDYHINGGPAPPGSMGNASRDAGGGPVCKDYLKGRCFREDRCKFYHPPDSESSHYDKMGYDEGQDFHPPPKRLRGDLPGQYGMAPRMGMGMQGVAMQGAGMHGAGMQGAGMQGAIEQENLMLHETVAALQQRILQLESANEMLLQQNAKLRSQFGSTGATNSGMAGGAMAKKMSSSSGMAWNGGGSGGGYY